MRNLAAISLAAVALVACGPKPEAAAPPAEAPAAVAPVAEAIDAASVTPPAPVAAGTDLMAGLAQGGSATVKLDACPKSNFNAAEKIGSLVCGGSYVVYYEGDTKRWVAVGPNAARVAAHDEEPRGAGKNPGPDPSQRMVVIWGLGLAVDATNKVALGDGTVVGHLVATPPA